MDRNVWDRIALVLIIIGALNWGLVGFLQFDLVAAIFGSATTMAARVIYAIIGLAGLYGITLFFREREVVKK
ncbi:MAG: DUF378 domain-containing protein [Firmicutes bacterium]|nr:DUF378 domain-containing protein [Bacillota bacterium]